MAAVVFANTASPDAATTMAAADPTTPPAPANSNDTTTPMAEATTKGSGSQVICSVVYVALSVLAARFF